ncbi:MAG: hypothetical protein ACK4K7_12690 [Allosphingosinicella sp.]|uniref:hypothetical protein n=1 Tax=Allosphingosinicella sp. TaxID=2823234 RepID=UPI0039432B55
MDYLLERARVQRSLAIAAENEILRETHLWMAEEFERRSRVVAAENRQSRA